MSHRNRIADLFVWIGLMGAALLLSACGPAVPERPIRDPDLDAHDLTKLPKVGPFYKVIGYRKGVRGFIVACDIGHGGTVYRAGDLLDEEGFAAVEALGVKTIISVTPTRMERDLAATHGMTLIEIPFTPPKLSHAHLRDFFWAVRENEGPFFFHCLTGPRRAGALMVHLRMGEQGWTYKRAVEEFVRLGGDTKLDKRMLTMVKTCPTGPPCGPRPKP